MAQKIAVAICFIVIAMRHAFEFKSKKVDNIVNGVSLTFLLILAFIYGVTP